MTTSTPLVPTAERPTAPARRGRTLKLGAVVLVVGLLVAACNEWEVRMTDLTRAARADAGLGMYQDNQVLHNKAISWAQKMAADGKLSHSNLAEGNPYAWKLLGENVGMGCGVTIDAIHNALMNSPGHKANIVNSRYNHWAVAVYQAPNGCYWVVEEFMQL